jgi:hypothetical protein
MHCAQPLVADVLDGDYRLVNVEESGSRTRARSVAFSGSWS